MSIGEVKGSLGVIAENIDGVSNGHMARVTESMTNLAISVAVLHTTVHETLAKATENRTECEALSATGQVAHDDMEAQNGAVAAVAKTSNSEYLTKELPARIRELASRAETSGTAEAIGAKLDEAIGALTTASVALLECTSLTQQGTTDAWETRGMMDTTAQEIRDHAAGM